MRRDGLAGAASARKRGGGWLAGRVLSVRRLRSLRDLAHSAGVANDGSFASISDARVTQDGTVVMRRKARDNADRLSRSGKFNDECGFNQHACLKGHSIGAAIRRMGPEIFLIDEINFGDVA